jgi:hypothetical protein
MRAIDERPVETRPGPVRPAPARRAAGIALVVALLAATAGVFAWEQGRIRDRDEATATALAERDAARSAAAGLEAQVASLQAEVGGLQGTIARLRDRVAELERQLAAPPAAPCDPQAMLAVVRREVPIGAGLLWESVEILECRNGYARVYAQAATTPGGEPIEDAEQVFLKDVEGTWRVITSGTGISCADPDLTGDLRRACRALGLA